MSQEPEPLDFPNAEPVTVEQALVAVAGWRASGVPLYGLHQVAVALANAYLDLEEAVHLIDQEGRDDGRVEAERHDADAAVALAAMAALAERVVALTAEVAEGQRTFEVRYGWMLERERALCEAALGCSEGMACRRPVWFGCCATRKRICEALGVEFHADRAGSSGSSVIDDVGPQAATAPGEAG